MRMNLFILSDLHILDANDPIYFSLLSLLRQRVSPGDTVVFAGDIFDLFVGNKSIFLKKYNEFFNVLSEVVHRGVRIFYIEGNHDFLIQGAFRKVPGISIHHREVSLEIGGKRFFIIHGDTVDRSDYGYRMIRAFFRSPLMRALVWICPGQWLDRIGQASSRYSRDHKPRLFSEIPIERRERLRCIYRSFAAEKISEDFDFVAMGHCHDLDEMSFNIGGRTGQYINVGFPRVHGSILRWSPGELTILREPL